MAIPLPDERRPLDQHEAGTLLTLLLVWEAAYEGDEDQAGIGCVVRNRVEHAPRYGNTWHEVMLKPGEFACFTEPRPDTLLRPVPHFISRTGWDECGRIASAVYAYELADPTGGATHYHHVRRPHGVKRWPPAWAFHMVRTRRIGAHAFYVEP